MSAPVHADAGASEQAAARRAARFAASLEGRVLDAVIAAGEDGLTALEARLVLGLPVEKQYSVSPRLSALKKKGLVRPTATVRDGYQAYVLVPAITEAGAA